MLTYLLIIIGIVGCFFAWKAFTKKGSAGCPSAGGMDSAYHRCEKSSSGEAAGSRAQGDASLCAEEKMKCGTTQVTSENVPEDYLTNKDFLAQLRADIAACKPSRPTDSVLQRHYDSIIDAELIDRLNAIAASRNDAASGLPPRPTDSVLRRHYDAMMKERSMNR